MRPPDVLPPLAEVGTPPPLPEQTSPPLPTTPGPGFTTPPPSSGPLAPLATPQPRPDYVDADGTRDLNERSSDPVGNGGDEPRELVDVTGDGTGTAGGPGDDGSGGGDANVLAASIAKLARTAGEAVKTFAFPLSLTILVIVFLLIQGEIDRRDPKLAFAPVDSSKDMVHFE